MRFEVPFEPAPDLRLADKRFGIGVAMISPLASLPGVSSMSASPSSSSSSFDCLENVKRLPVEIAASSSLLRGRLAPGEGVVTALDEGAVVPEDVDGMRYFAGVEKLGKEPSERSCKVIPDCEDESARECNAADIIGQRKVFVSRGFTETCPAPLDKSEFDQS